MKLSESHEELKKTHQALSDKYEKREALVDELVRAARTSTKSVDEVGATLVRHTSPSCLVGSPSRSPKCTDSPAHAPP
jgi:predicted  nucleic acid-binding Zn-ribbon protein